MTSRERVIHVINHNKPDRVPIYGWVRANLEEPISKAFGSVEAFEDRYEFDLAHLFGGPHSSTGAGKTAFCSAPKHGRGSFIPITNPRVNSSKNGGHFSVSTAMETF